MDVQVKSGPVSVAASGTVIAFENKPIEFAIEHNSENLAIVVEFRTSEDNKKRSDKPQLQTLIEGSNTLRLVLLDFFNPLGSGSTKPLEIGTIGGKKLYLHFRAYDLEGSDRTLHYTFYLGG